MIFVAYAFGIIAGLALGIGLALYITTKLVKKSNDIGDSKGQFMDFGDYIRPLNHLDNERNPY
ncbi:MAG: hypothetical protein K5654_10440 [Lachnospiraceae bacterium]|nr:hypothetical protein [Lachnospiraceae bacterium]